MDLTYRDSDSLLKKRDPHRLNAPPIAGGYNELLKHIRTSNSLPADVRELLASSQIMSVVSAC